MPRRANVGLEPENTRRVKSTHLPELVECLVLQSNNKTDEHIKKNKHIKERKVKEGGPSDRKEIIPDENLDLYKEMKSTGTGENVSKYKYCLSFSMSVKDNSKQE